MSRRNTLFIAIAVLLVALDQISKAIISHYFLPGQSAPVVGDFFRLTYILNPGGVFGSRLGGSFFYSIVSVVAIIFTLIFFAKTDPRQNLVKLGLAVILAGALGNIIDRIRLGKVIDFLDFNIPDLNFPSLNLGLFKLPGFYLDRWPIFNLADSAITVGAILIFAQILISRKKAGPQIGAG
ncbi:MAG: signal peptidase II [candidate division Zixibacteria bacterium]|nr:signal peptidase II [candidate division Zixibacteria bacterium]